MSVVYGKRSLSDMEFWKQMIKLEREVRNSLLHDFGIKNRIREPDFYSRICKMEEEDAEAFKALCEKYDLISIVDKYPEWMIDDFRSAILRIIREIKQDIPEWSLEQEKKYKKRSCAERTRYDY